MSLFLYLLKNAPLWDSVSGFLVCGYLDVQVILDFAFFNQAEITRFGYKNLSAQIVLCADFTPVVKFQWMHCLGPLNQSK